MKKILISLFSLIVFVNIYSQGNSKVVFSQANSEAYSKLKSVLFQNGVLLREGEINNNDFNGLVLVQYGEIKTDLPKLYTFVKNGGRALVLLGDKDLTRFNDSFQDLFELSIATETVKERKSSNYIQGGSICRLWPDLLISAGSNNNAGIQTYLVLLNENEWTKTSINSDETGKERVLSAHRRLGSGEILFLTSFSSSRFDEMSLSSSSFTITGFNNETIGLMDNEKAMILIYKWLAGKSEYR